MTTIKGPVYRIQTSRLVLRCWNPEDAPSLKEAVDSSLDHLQPWFPWAEGEPQDIQSKIDLIRGWRGSFDLGRDFVYGIFSPDGKTVLGSTGLHIRHGSDTREIGYWLRKDATGKGYALETAAALTRIAFEVDRVRYILIRCLVSNERSAAVPRKLGYRMEGIARRRIFASGGYGDEMNWTLFDDEFPASPSAITPLEAFDALGRRII